MRTHLLLILLSAILTIMTIRCQTELPVANTIDQRIEQIVKANLTLGAAPGYAVGIIKNGQKTYYSFGTQDLSTGKPFDKYTIGEIGSVTKPFTALLFADLVNKGRISLDDSANRYMPTNLKLPSKNGTSIKILHLLNHTSGLTKTPDDIPLILENPYGDYDAEKMTAYLKRVVLTSNPGAEFEYSNTGLGLAGFLISRITGKSYQQNIKEVITQPLGMQMTFINEGESPSSNVAQGYLASKEMPFWKRTEFFEGNGAIKSNVNDMLLYINAFMNSSSNTGLEEAFTRVKKPTFKIAANREIGLGWFILTTTDETKYFHNGATGGFSSFLVCVPEKKTGVFILSNSSTAALTIDTIGSAILSELLKK